MYFISSLFYLSYFNASPLLLPFIISPSSMHYLSWFTPLPLHAPLLTLRLVRSPLHNRLFIQISVQRYYFFFTYASARVIFSDFLDFSYISTLVFFSIKICTIQKFYVPLHRIKWNELLDRILSIPKDNPNITQGLPKDKTKKISINILYYIYTMYIYTFY